MVIAGLGAGGRSEEWRLVGGIYITAVGVRFSTADGMWPKSPRAESIRH